MNGDELECVKNTKYLGATISEDLSWTAHTEQAAGKAHGMLAFLQRNLWMLPVRLREKAYLTIVRPGLEYASSITDPYLKKDTKKLEDVQRHAARFVTNNPLRRFNAETEQVSVTSLLDDLGWQTLKERRKNARCTLMFRVREDLVAVPEEFKPRQPNTHLRSSHRNTVLSTKKSKVDSHHYSFIPRTSRDWNRLPLSARTADTLEGFKAALQPLV